MHLEIATYRGRWSWFLFDKNDLFAASTKSYARKSDAKRAFYRMRVMFK